MLGNIAAHKSELRLTDTILSYRISFKSISKNLIKPSS